MTYNNFHVEVTWCLESMIQLTNEINFGRCKGYKFQFLLLSNFMVWPFSLKKWVKIKNFHSKN